MTGLERSKDWWLKRISTEPDCPITAGVPTERDRLWTIQQYAAVGIEATNDTGPLADLFAAIHREAATALTSNAPIRNEAAAQETPTRQRQDRNGLGPKDGGSVAESDAPEHQSDTPS